MIIDLELDEKIYTENDFILIFSRRTPFMMRVECVYTSDMDDYIRMVNDIEDLSNYQPSIMVSLIPWESNTIIYLQNHCRSMRWLLDKQNEYQDKIMDVIAEQLADVYPKYTRKIDLRGNDLPEFDIVAQSMINYEGILIYDTYKIIMDTEYLKIQSILHDFYEELYTECIHNDNIQRSMKVFNDIYKRDIKFNKGIAIPPNESNPSMTFLFPPNYFKE